jgi:transmembrane protein
VSIGSLGIAILLWDSGFGRLAAFNNGIEAASLDHLEQDVLFGFAVILLQVGALALIMTDRWIWLGAITLGGLGILTLPGSQPWFPSGAAFENFWAIAGHLSIFFIFIFATILSGSIRRGMKMRETTSGMPELSWRRMVLADEDGLRHDLQARQSTQGIIDRFYNHLHGNAANG